MTEITRVAVIGAGVMGSGIAQVLAASGVEVALHDVSLDALASAEKAIEHGRFGLRAGEQIGKLPPGGADGALARLRFSDDLADACAGAELVVEAVYEELGLKVELFRRLDELCAPGTILTSNTAGLPVVALARATDRPELVLGWHWAQPCPVMRLAELVVHPGTDPAATATVSALARHCGKNPVVVNDFPQEWGFVVNRIMRAVRRESARVVEDGVATPEQVDTLMRDCFRWPMGPFELQGTRQVGEH